MEFNYVITLEKKIHPTRPSIRPKNPKLQTRMVIRIAKSNKTQIMHNKRSPVNKTNKNLITPSNNNKQRPTINKIPSNIEFR